jgi:hypothetical protein
MGQDGIGHCGVLIRIKEGEGVGEANGSDDEKLGKPLSPREFSPVSFFQEHKTYETRGHKTGKKNEEMNRCS